MTRRVIDDERGSGTNAVETMEVEKERDESAEEQGDIVKEEAGSRDMVKHMSRQTEIHRSQYVCTSPGQSNNIK